MHADTGAIRRDVAALVRPAPRQTIPETARKVVVTPTGGAYDPDFTHAMVQPAECITSRAYEAVVFVGPAQAGKTLALVENPVAHAITTDPQDVMIIQTAKDQARDFSKRRIDRMHQRSPEVGRHLGTGDSDDNTFDKTYLSGMILSIVWPSKNITAGKAIPMVIATDTDRIKDDAGGEGSLFDVLLPRTRSFKSRGILVFESSPSRPVLKADWKAATPHEAPPTKGILGTFNGGDRRRHYCRCQHCLEYWMPDPGPDSLFIPEDGTELERAERCGLICGTCGAINTAAEHQDAVKASFVWLKEGQTIDSDGTIHGAGRRSRIASFWMPGYAARYETWQGLAEKLIRAEDEFERTQGEESLEAVVNTGFAAPHMSRALRPATTALELLKRTEAEDERAHCPRGVVPPGGRVLVPTIDNQGGSFVVQVHAFGVGGRCWVIDRYSIELSEARRDEDGQKLPLRPATYKKDFAQLREQVLERSYPTADGQQMRPHVVGQDLSGEPGVSPNVYAFWRDMRKARLASRYRIVRGGKRLDTPIWEETFPDKTVPGKKAARMKGDVPVITLNVHKLKDKIKALLDQKEDAEGHIYLPAWADVEWFEELLAEARGAERWEQIGRRNESLDLLVYALGLWQVIGGNVIDWDAPPVWASPWEENENVLGQEKKTSRARRFASSFGNGSRGGSDPWLG